MADLVLEGHTLNAEFAVGISSAAPLVASGGKDKKVGCMLAACRAVPHTFNTARTHVHLHTCTPTPAQPSH